MLQQTENQRKFHFQEQEVLLFFKVRYLNFFPLILFSFVEKQSSRGVLRKRWPENMQQVYGRTHFSEDLVIGTLMGEACFCLSISLSWRFLRRDGFMNMYKWHSFVQRVTWLCVIFWRHYEMRENNHAHPTATSVHSNKLAVSTKHFWRKKHLRGKSQPYELSLPWKSNFGIHEDCFG